MNNICTPTTAARLKAAGFPQPAPAPGQFWYSTLFTGVLGVLIGHTLYFIDGDGFTTIGSPDDLLFAPGVADLLRELPGYDIGYYTAVEGKPVFIAFDDNGEKAAEGKNPAEALAAAWLWLHENPADLDDF